MSQSKFSIVFSSSALNPWRISGSSRWTTKRHHISDDLTMFSFQFLSSFFLISRKIYFSTKLQHSQNDEATWWWRVCGREFSTTKDPLKKTMLGCWLFCHRRCCCSLVIRIPTELKASRVIKTFCYLIYSHSFSYSSSFSFFRLHSYLTLLGCCCCLFIVILPCCRRSDGKSENIIAFWSQLAVLLLLCMMNFLNAYIHKCLLIIN